MVRDRMMEVDQSNGVRHHKFIYDRRCWFVIDWPIFYAFPLCLSTLASNNGIYFQHQDFSSDSKTYGLFSILYAHSYYTTVIYIFLYIAVPKYGKYARDPTTFQRRPLNWKVEFFRFLVSYTVLSYGFAVGNVTQRAGTTQCPVAMPINSLGRAESKRPEEKHSFVISDHVHQ